MSLTNTVGTSDWLAVSQSLHLVLDLPESTTGRFRIVFSELFDQMGSALPQTSEIEFSAVPQSEAPLQPLTEESGLFNIVGLSDQNLV